MDIPFEITFRIGDEYITVFEGAVPVWLEDGELETGPVISEPLSGPEHALIATWLGKCVRELREEYEDAGGDAAARADHRR